MLLWCRCVEYLLGVESNYPQEELSYAVLSQYVSPLCHVWTKGGRQIVDRGRGIRCYSLRSCVLRQNCFLG